VSGDRLYIAGECGSGPTPADRWGLTAGRITEPEGSGATA
jgi:hypothetical protein